MCIFLGFRLHLLFAVTVILGVKISPTVLVFVSPDVLGLPQRYLFKQVAVLSAIILFLYRSSINMMVMCEGRKHILNSHPYVFMFSEPVPLACDFQKYCLLLLTPQVTCEAQKGWSLDFPFLHMVYFLVKLKLVRLW